MIYTNDGEHSEKNFPVLTKGPHQDFDDSKCKTEIEFSNPRYLRRDLLCGSSNGRLALGFYIWDSDTISSSLGNRMVHCIADAVDFKVILLLSPGSAWNQGQVNGAVQQVREALNGKTVDIELRVPQTKTTEPVQLDLTGDTPEPVHQLDSADDEDKGTELYYDDDESVDDASTPVDVKFPEGITILNLHSYSNGRAFKPNSIQSVEFPSTLRVIGPRSFHEAFFYEDNMQMVHVDAQMVERVGEDAFSSNPTAYIELGDHCVVGDNALYNTANESLSVFEIDDEFISLLDNDMEA